MSLNKLQCPICLKDYTKKTLDKYSGICGKCFNKQNKDEPNSQPKTGKDACLKCSKPFTKQTLKRNNGVCGKCATNNMVTKEFCAKCLKEITQKASEKYNKMCNSCYRKDTQLPVFSSALIGIPIPCLGKMCSSL